MRKLNLTDDERIGCRVTYNVNRFEVYGAAGSALAECMLTAAYSKEDLKTQLAENGLVGATFDAIACAKYSKLFA